MYVGAAGRPKLRGERQPFLALKAVIFGVNPTGPHILVVVLAQISLLLTRRLIINSQPDQANIAMCQMVPTGLVRE
jgi:hypothetical protein